MRGMQYLSGVSQFAKGGRRQFALILILVGKFECGGESFVLAMRFLKIRQVRLRRSFGVVGSAVVPVGNRVGVAPPGLSVCRVRWWCVLAAVARIGIPGRGARTGGVSILFRCGVDLLSTVRAPSGVRKSSVGEVLQLVCLPRLGPLKWPVWFRE
ncbi:hypothetical protein Zmor_003401 [Zophobas morio]|uniref:Uncharacterized protein n=1 Tax=Zophobas morio TaxID=2755281 RepID=A0AA38HML7_9CUCU|nr:hypothetical protein Zmor_003401 [Zophobas morio]